MARTLALVEQGTTLKAEGERLKIEKDGRMLGEVKLHQVQEVLAFGAIGLTPSARALLLRRGVDVVFLTMRGQYRGRLSGWRSKNVELKLAQYRRLTEPRFALDFARSVVRGKIRNQRNLLLRQQREHKREDLANAIGELRRTVEMVTDYDDLDALRGVEGRAAAIYFRMLGTCARQREFHFTRRTRRPPKDAANALLSFGYTLLGSIAEAAVLRAGLDPLFGALHAPSYGRPSLMLDLIEEFRPVVVDALMLRLINRREVGPEDFEIARTDPDEIWAENEEGAVTEGEGVWLNETGRRVFFRAWGRRLRDVQLYPPRNQRLMLEEIVRQQVYHFARVLLGEDDHYESFTPR